MGGDLVDGELMRRRISDNSALADVFAAGFKLRLDEDDGLAQRGRGLQYGLDQEGGGDERNIHHQQSELPIRWAAERSGQKEAGIGALNQAHAWIVAQFHRNLAEAGIDGGDMRSSTLQQAVGKPTRGCADVEACAITDIDVPVIEGPGQLDAAAAYERQIVAEKPDRGVTGNGVPRLVELLFIDENSPREDEGAGPLPAGRKITLDQKEIETRFGGSDHGSILIMTVCRE